jgi:hypothetical protein
VHATCCLLSQWPWPTAECCCPNCQLPTVTTATPAVLTARPLRNLPQHNGQAYQMCVCVCVRACVRACVCVFCALGLSSSRHKQVRQQRRRCLACWCCVPRAETARVQIVCTAWMCSSLQSDQVGTHSGPNAAPILQTSWLPPPKYQKPNT